MSFADINNQFLDNYYFFENSVSDNPEYWVSSDAIEVTMMICEEVTE